MLVYVVQHENEPYILGVFDSEEKAQEAIEEQPERYRAEFEVRPFIMNAINK